jgi:hypothetical protein
VDASDWKLKGAFRLKRTLNKSSIQFKAIAFLELFCNKIYSIYKVDAKNIENAGIASETYNAH